MLRISCTCGKFLKIDDKLLGKKIKCPACGAAQVVKKEPDVAERTNGKPPPAVPKGTGKAPAPAKRAKQTERRTPWLLIGGTLAGVLAVAGIAGGVWFSMSREEKPKPAPVAVVAKAPKVEEPPPPEPTVPLENKNDVVAPTPPDPKPAAPAPLVLRLKNVKAAWVDGQPAINLTADYTMAGDGKPNPKAGYILQVKLADGTGSKKSYRVQLVVGMDLQTEGKFANPKVAVSLPPKDMASVCDVELVEKAPGNPDEVVIDSQANIFISGTPASPTPAVVAAVAVDLSNAKVERLPNKKTRFTVDYKFTSGKADASKTYRLLAGMSAGKTSQPQAKAFQGKGDQLDSQGTLTYDIALDSTASTKFELWLTEAAGTNSKATVVSNKLAGKVTGNAADPAPVKVHFQISPPLAVKMKANAKAPAQTFTLTFQWQLSSGKLNPQATYSAILAVPGAAPQPLATVQGSQFQAAGTFNQVLPYTGQTFFSIYIVEAAPDQPPRTASNVQNVKVR